MGLRPRSGWQAGDGASARALDLGAAAWVYPCPRLLGWGFGPGPGPGCAGRPRREAARGGACWRFRAAAPVGRRPTDETSRRAGPRTALRTPSPRDNLSDPPGAGPRAPASFHILPAPGRRPPRDDLSSPQFTSRRGRRTRKAAGSQKRFPPPFSRLRAGRLSSLPIPAASRVSGALPARIFAPRQAAGPAGRSFGPSQRRPDPLARRGDASPVEPPGARPCRSRPSSRAKARFLGPSRQFRAPGGPTSQRSPAGERFRPASGGSAAAAQPRSSQRPPRDLGSRWPTRRGEAVAAKAPSDGFGRRLSKAMVKRPWLDRILRGSWSKRPNWTEVFPADRGESGPVRPPAWRRPRKTPGRRAPTPKLPSELAEAPRPSRPFLTKRGQEFDPTGVV